jgi:hypothetical protein
MLSLPERRLGAEALPIHIFLFPVVTFHNAVNQRPKLPHHSVRSFNAKAHNATLPEAVSEVMFSIVFGQIPTL